VMQHTHELRALPTMSADTSVSATQQQALVPSPPERSSLPTEHSIPCENQNTRPSPREINQSQAREAMQNNSVRRPEWVSVRKWWAANAVALCQDPFWSVTVPRIGNACGVLGLLLAVILGVSQWLAQDKSNAIAKESELVTLALSCVDKV
jgi:hypothetical protein